MTDFLESLILEYGLAKLLVAFGGILTGITGLGFLIKPEVAAFCAGTALTLVLLLTVVFQGVDRRRLYSQDAQHKRTMNRYAAWIIKQQSAEAFSIDQWHEEIEVFASGDVTLERWITLKIGSQPLETFWHRCYRSTAAPNRRYQSKVRATINAFELEDSSRTVGVRIDHTAFWEEGDSLRVIGHLANPAEADSILRIRIRISWPEYYKELLEAQGVEPFEWKLSREARDFSLNMTFDKGLKLKTDLLVTPFGTTTRPSQEQRGNGELILKYSPDLPRPGVKFGFQLQRPE